MKISSHRPTIWRVHIPLPVLLVLVVVGMSLIVGLTHLLGGSVGATLTEAAIRARLTHDLPDRTATDITLSSDQRSALVALEDGTVAVVFVLGKALVSRILPAQPQLTETASGLRLRLRDPGCPRVTLALPASAHQRWLARLQ